jgi:hypothetical protein
LVKRIVRDSQAPRQREAILRFVEDHLHEGTQFALGESNVFWEVHRRVLPSSVEVLI